jgi:hypothetical protein
MRLSDDWVHVHVRFPTEALSVVSATKSRPAAGTYIGSTSGARCLGLITLLVLQLCNM